MNVKAGQGADKVTKEQSVAEELMNFVGRISERSQRVADHVEQKLAPVMLQSTPSVPEPSCKEANGREYPPLFEEINDRLLLIERAFNQIERTLGRTEL